MTTDISLSADIVDFSLELGSLDGDKSLRSVDAMLALHNDPEYRSSWT